LVVKNLWLIKTSATFEIIQKSPSNQTQGATLQDETTLQAPPCTLKRYHAGPSVTWVRNFHHTSSTLHERSTAMKNNTLGLFAVLAVLAGIPRDVLAHGGSKDVKLHLTSRWKECSIQLDPSLTQEAWRQFTQEAGLVAYFRSLTDARPMGAGNYEFSILQWKTAIDDTEPAWNDTFVHPDSTHWLFEGSGLAFPGLTFRAGITDQIDVGVYFTKNPNANYGFWGAQVQYSLLDDREDNWAASVRTSLVSLYGPDDVGLTIVGLDLLASREYEVVSDLILVSPYAGVSGYLASSHERSAMVHLNDERTLGAQAMVGAVTRISLATLSLEYNVARVNSLSMKVGVNF
jgi:hypothetical protein